MKADDRPASARSGRLLHAVHRLFAAHALAYPLAFLAAVAAMPLVIHASGAELAALEAAGQLEATGDLVVRKVLRPAGLVFALPHLLVAPWALGRDEARSKRFFFVALAILGGACLGAGGAGWAWLWLR